MEQKKNIREGKERKGEYDNKKRKRKKERRIDRE